METIEKLFEHELKDVFDAEKRLIRALPKMAKAAESEELRNAFTEHLNVTKGQVGRLEQVFEAIGKKAAGKACKGMQGLIEEGEEVISEVQEDGGPVGDLALVGAARRVEHYEMAAYMTLIGLAENMEDSRIQELLQQNLAEEEEADELLSGIASDLMGEAQAGAEMEEEEEAETSPATHSTARAAAGRQSPERGGTAARAAAGRRR